MNCEYNYSVFLFNSWTIFLVFGIAVFHLAAQLQSVEIIFVLCPCSAHSKRIKLVSRAEQTTLPKQNLVAPDSN